MTNPGNQTGTVGTAINASAIPPTYSASGQTLTYSATGLPPGPVDLVERPDLRHPDQRR